MPTINASNPLLATVATTGNFSDLLGLPAFMPIGGIWNHTLSSGTSGAIFNSPGPAWSSCTQLDVSTTDKDGNDRSTLLALIRHGDYVSIWLSPSSYAILQVTAISVSSGVYSFSTTNVMSVGNVDDTFNVAYFFGLVYRALATVATSGAYSDLTGTPTLATVAMSGNYSDLSGLPTGLTQAIPLLAPDGTTTVTLNFNNGLLQSVT